jgi:hypothetical protein
MVTSWIPRTRSSRRFCGLLLLLPLPLPSACPHQVPVPALNNDTPPKVTINGFLIHGGTVSQDNVSSSQTVQVSLGAELQFTVTATNPGGVESLSYVFSHGIRSTSVSMSATLDANGQGPDGLTILGSDSAGHPGSIPVILAETPATSAVPLPASMTVTATNFNGMSTSFVVLYVPHWSAPQIVSFKPTPNYINIGSASRLSWQINGCSAYCEVRIEGRDGPTSNDLVESHPNRPASGILDVHPTRSTDTYYTLTATNPQSSAAIPWIAKVTLAPAPLILGQPFYFKMTRPGGATPCFTMAISAPDASTAKLWAEAQNGGYQASPILEPEYTAGC